MNVELLAWIMLALAGVAGSAIASGTETGVYCMNRVRLRLRASAVPSDHAARRLRAEIGDPERLLATLLIANNAFNYIGALGITAVLAAAGFSDPMIILLNALVLTPLLFVFGESLPKEIFRIEADRLTYALAYPIGAARLLLTITLALPLVRIATGTLVRLLGSNTGGLVSARERVVSLIKEGASHGVLSVSQLRLVDRAMALGETTVGDEMIPWARVRTVSVEWGRDRVLALLEREKHSRFPVVDRRGRVIGVASFLDMVLNPDADLRDLVTEPARLHPADPVRGALLQVHDAQTPIGIVERDGRPLGLVTNKDLVEPLTGELAEW